jgi:hypothetical protein
LQEAAVVSFNSSDIAFTPARLEHARLPSVSTPHLHGGGGVGVVQLRPARGRSKGAAPFLYIRGGGCLAARGRRRSAAWVGWWVWAAVFLA